MIPEHTESNLIKVNQHEIKAMLKDRGLNPQKYADRPLLIWRANFYNYIQWKVFFQFEPFNSQILKSLQQRFPNSNYYNEINIEENNAAMPRLIHMKLDNIRDNAFYLPENASNPYQLFYFFFYLPVEYLVKPLLYKEYSHVINSDWLIKEQECLNNPIVVFLPFLEDPEAFAGYDQYVFIPDFKEWKEEKLAHDVFLTKHLIGFLESSESEEERNYRWNWYFQRLKDSEGSSNLKSHFEGKGCDFPYCWIEGLLSFRHYFFLPMAQIPKNYIPPKPTKISEIPIEKFKDCFNVGISEDVIEEFRNYLMAHNVEIQGNIRK